MSLASQDDFWSLSGYKELKLSKNLFIGQTPQGPLFQMQNISFLSLGMSRKQNFEIQRNPINTDTYEAMESAPIKRVMLFQVKIHLLFRTKH